MAPEYVVKRFTYHLDQVRDDNHGLLYIPQVKPRSDLHQMRGF